MKSKQVLLILVFALLFSTARLGSAQGVGSASGRVTDPQGAAIAGASIAVFARGGAAAGSTTTDADGRYHFDALPPGNYILQAEAPGFDRFSMRDLRIERGSNVTLDLPLRIADFHQQVVVTASSTPQTPDEVSKAVTVVDRQEIDARDEFAISEVLRPTPGLRVGQLGGPGAFTGIRLRGLHNEETAVLVDGLRFRDASATQADASGLLQDLLVTGVDHVEILRGPGSSLYGTNAIGGAINLITDEGGGRNRGSVLLEGGSLGLFRGRAQFAGGALDNRIQYSAALTHLNVTNGLDGDSPARTTSGQGRISFRISPGTQLIAQFYAADSFAKLKNSPTGIGILPPIGVVNAVPLSLSELRRYETGTPVSQLSRGNATFIPSADDPDGARAGQFFSGVLILSGHPSENLSYTLSYHGVATLRTFDNGPAGVGFQPLGSTRSDFNGRIQTVSGRLDYQLRRSNLLSGGYEFEDENYSNISLDRLNPGATSTTDVTQRSNTVFVQDQQRLFGDRMQVSGGFRVQAFSLERPQFSPAANAPYSNVTFSSPPTAYTGDGSVAYFLRPGSTKLRGHVGRGYRAPSLFERFGAGFDSVYGYSVYGDPGLRPERSISFDAGIDQSFFHERLRTSATYFYTRLQEVVAFNLLTSVDPFGRFFGYFNTHGGLARGVELSSQISATRSLNITAAYTYTNAIERTPIAAGVLRSFLAPEHQFSVVAMQRVGQRVLLAFDFTASSNYLAPIFSGTTRAYRFDGIKQAGMSISYRKPLTEFRALRVFAKVNNLFNQSYYESGFRTPGITATSGLQFEF